MGCFNRELNVKVVVELKGVGGRQEKIKRIGMNPHRVDHKAWLKRPVGVDQRRVSYHLDEENWNMLLVESSSHDGSL